MLGLLGGQQALILCGADVIGCAGSAGPAEPRERSQNPPLRHLVPLGDVGSLDLVCTGLDLVCTGVTSPDLAGHDTLLAGFGDALAEALNMLAGERPMAFEALRAVTTPYGGVGLCGVAAPQALWALDLSRSLLPAASVGVFLDSRGGERIYVAWPEGSAEDARRSLVARVVRSEGVILARDVSADALSAAGANDLVGVRLEMGQGEVGALVWFGSQPGEFDAECRVR